MSPADSPWWNSCCEALIRSVKKVIRNAIDQTNLTFSEFQTVLFQCSNLFNERPLGVNKSSEHDFTYLCPNDVLLGRSSSKVPVDNFSDQNPLSRRIAFIESLVNSFWKKWTRCYFPFLLVEQKWHYTRRNVRVGDIVIIHDEDLARSDWKLGKMSDVIAGTDGVIRRLEIQYKSKGCNQFTSVTRSVQRVVVILPIEEQLQ